MRGVILAGGAGSRLEPLTRYTSKQLLPVYDKPLIYYPLTTLMLAGISEILIITAPKQQESFQSLLGSGAQWGISIEYAVQQKPKGLPDGLLIAESFLGNESCAFILGDNLFYGTGLGRTLKEYTNKPGSQIFAYHVPDPERFGIVELNAVGKVLSIEEKPAEPKSTLAITGLYFLDKRAVKFAKKLKFSNRDELEMVDLLKNYLELDQLNVKILPRGTAWFDTGTFQSLNDAANFVRIIQENQGIKIGDPSEVFETIHSPIKQ